MCTYEVAVLYGISIYMGYVLYEASGQCKLLF